MSNQLLPFTRNAFYERAFFFIPHYNVIVLGTIKGLINSKDFEEAVDKLCHKHPLMNVHVEIKENGSGWFIAKEFIKIPIKKFKRNDENTWKEIVSNELRNQFKITEGSLIRILWIYNEYISDLILLSHHIICDGRSLMWLLHDLLNFLGNKVPVDKIEPVPPIDQVFPVDKVKINLLPRIMYSILNKFWRKSGIQVNSSDFEPIFQDSFTRKLSITTWMIDSELTSRIIKKCHEKKVSVNSCLFAALLSVQKEFRRELKSTEMSSIAIDFRKYCKPPVGSGLGFYASPLIFKYRINLKDLFSKRVKDLNKFLIKLATPNQIFQQAKITQIIGPNNSDNKVMLFTGLQIKNQPEIFHKMIAESKKDKLMSIFLKIMSKKLKNSQSILGVSFTNLGNTTLNEKYGDLELKKVIFCPPVFVGTEKLIGTCTFAGIIQHSIISYEDQINKKELQDFIDRYIEILKNF